VQDLPPVIDYEGSDYQSSFWDQGSRAYEDQAEAIALKRLLPTSGKLLLELGAGAGRNTSRYRNFDRVVLLDYSLSQLQQAQKRLGKSERYIYVAANIYSLPFVPALFDAATMIRTLHHMADAPLALCQVRQTLQTGAVFILEYANKHNLKAIFRYLLRRQNWNPFSLEPVEYLPLNFDFHPRAVRRWLQESGFHIQRQLTVSHFRIGFLKRLAPLKLLVMMDAIAQWTGGWWQLSPSVFTRCQSIGETLSASPGSFFRCPACANFPLDESTQALSCPKCEHNWPVLDGIMDFRYSGAEVTASTPAYPCHRT